LFRGYQQC